MIRKGRVVRRTVTVEGRGVRQFPRGGDLRGDLRLGQYPAVSGLGALRYLQFNHANRGILVYRLAERRLVEYSTASYRRRRAASEVSGADVPHQVAAAVPVRFGYPTLAGILRLFL